MKNIYVILERLGQGPQIRGYDFYICPWDDYGNILHGAVDEMELGEPCDFRITVLEMTEKEYMDYCAENEIDLTGDLAT